MGIVVIPAIDIRAGSAVRLSQGDFNRETRYFEDPLDAAKRWEEIGAERLHIVDLDAAKEGYPVNRDVIERIAGGIDIPIEVGGGIRSMDVVEDYISMGVRWVILGTAAIDDRDFAESAATKYQDRIILGIDAKDGIVKTKGWKESSDLSYVELARSYSDIGISSIIYTDIRKDGVGTGVDIDGAREIARETGIPVIASGGVKDISDIERVMEAEGDGVIGVIVGRAIYEGTLDLGEAISVAKKGKK
jgi:phosphoribosylformimino-5-aminoimidazole carboxamide ribotide isomerase